MAYLFIYGTLKFGERNAGIMSGQFLRQVRTEPRHRLVDFGDFPGLSSGTQAIEGELWEVDQEMLEQLDQFEGVHNGVYVRQLIELEDGTQAYAYLANCEMPDYEGTNWHG